MKSKIYIALILIIAAVMFTSAALAELPSIKYMNRWPEPSPNTITKAGDYIYYGDGEMISVYHADDLDLRARVSIPLSGDSTGLVELEPGGVSGTEGIAGVVVQGDYLYVACGSEGLRIFDVSEPEELGPEKLISYYILRKEGKRAFVKDVAVSGDTAYLAYYFFTGEGYDSGMQVLDVANMDLTTPPGLVGEAQLTTLFPIELKKAQRVVVSGDNAYMADLYNGLVVFDVSDREIPEIVGHYFQGSVFDVAVYGNYAYLASAKNGLIVVEVNENDLQKGTIVNLNRVAACVYADFNTNAAAVRVSNGHAYVGDADLGLVVIDVSSPEEVDEFSVTGWYPYYLSGDDKAETDMAGVFQLYEENGMVYAGDSVIGLQKIDVSNVNLIEEPYHSPSFVASSTTPADAAALFIDVETSYVYVVDDGPAVNGFKEGLRILFAIESEEGITFLLKGMLSTDGEARDVYVDGGYVYVADGSGGLKIIDPGPPPADADGSRATAKPVSPELVGSCLIPDGDAVGVYVKDGYAYVAAKDGGLKIINVSNPSAPFIEGQIGDPFLTDTRAVEVADGIAYVADGGEGLSGSEPGYVRLVDVSDKENPVVMGEFPLYDSNDMDDIPGVARDLALVGDLVYVAAANEGIQVINVSDPFDPKWYDQYNAPPYKDYNTAIYAVRSEANLDLIWVANGLSRESMGFLSYPRTVPLQNITIYRSAGNTRDVFAVGDYAYIADGVGGLHALAVDEGKAEFGDWYDDPVVLPKKQFGDSNTCFIRTASGCPYSGE